MMAFRLLQVSCLTATIALSLGVRDYCTDPAGNHLALGDKWEEGTELCECISQDMLYPFLTEENPSDLVKHCLLNGCPADGCNTDIVKEGATFMHGHDECICHTGTSLRLADFSTLYHGVCQSRSGDSYDLTFDR